MENTELKKAKEKKSNEISGILHFFKLMKPFG